MRQRANRVRLLAIFVVLAAFLTFAGQASAGSYKIGGTYRVDGTNPNGTPYTGTVTVTQSGDTYQFNWKVGTTYSGSGKLAGDMLTVHWGDKYPVIYKVHDGGSRMVGIWANGAATEILSK